jgi:hypothetical protein
MTIGHKFKQKSVIAAVLLMVLTLSAQLFCQTTTSSLSGTVTDASKAVLPGASVTAINSETGVKATATTNSAGVYNFASLQPGTYKVTAQVTGFQPNTITDVKLAVSAQNRLNFELTVAGVSTQIEVQSSAQDMILESSSSTGTVLGAATAELPLVSNNVMDIVNVMGGVVRNTSDSVFGASSQTFAGVASSNVNIQRDGVVVRDVRYASGSGTPARINPDMVGEFKMVLSPVDAEMGRGVGQLTFLTKSGSNTLHGTGNWNNMNTALDANEWSNNRTMPRTTPNWRNINDYTASVGGPIIKNKTFFFATWNQTIVRQKQLVRAPVLTPCARKGIYRYFSGWIPGNTQTTINRTNTMQTRASVNADGTPLSPADGLTAGSPYTGTGPLDAQYPQFKGLNFQSVLGQLDAATLALVAQDPINCSKLPDLAVGAANGIIAGTNWDTNRKAYDPSGYISRFTGIMPQANDYYIGDGLNVGDLRWIRSQPGQDTVYGIGEDNERRAITIKLDHNLNEQHRLSGTYSYEKDTASAAESAWPDGFRGITPRKPYTFTVAVTSTLRPTLLNEAHFGMAYNEMHNTDPLMNPETGDKMKALLQTLLPTTNFPNWKGLPVPVGPGSGGMAFVSDTYSANAAGSGASYGISNPMGGRGDLEATWGDKDRRWTMSDTMTWTKGSHSFKGGAEYRLTRSKQDTNGWAQFTNSSNTYPYVQGGNTINSQPAGIGTKWAGMVGTDGGNSSTGTYQAAYNLMNYIAGSVGQIRQYYFVNTPNATSWNDPTSANVRLIDLRQKELSFFFKDDWKVNQDLTLNLGIRWDYYGVPWEGSGMSAGLVGGAQSIFGCQGGNFDKWMSGAPCDTTKLTTSQFIGPKSPHPDLSLYDKDLNNFGPAVGFAWQLPWFGKGKTTLRGGYQLTFIPIDTADPNGGFGLELSAVPGMIYPTTYTGDTGTRSYLDLTMVKDLVPTLPLMDQSIKPLAVRPLTDRASTTTMTVYDPSIVNPYMQSLTLALTRQVGSAVTVDVRYIGTLSRKMKTTTTLNSVNFINNGLAAALTVARAGGESALLDKLIKPSTLVASTVSGAAQLRASTTTRTNLANGNFAGIASSLATNNGCASTQPGCLMPATPAGVNGALLRYSGTQENFIYTNPQFGTANWVSNRAHANYHSMQAQVTMRPTQGLNFQVSYTWSRNLGDQGQITDQFNRAADYGLLASNRTHNIASYGSYTLPLGAKGYLFKNSGKPVQRIVEGWQISWTNAWMSGPPASASITYQGVALNSMWAGTAIDQVGPFDRTGGQVTWDPGAFAGSYYGTQFTQVIDPQCSSSAVAASLQSYCGSSLHALALKSDPTKIVLQHAQPGVRGNFQTNSLIGFGSWQFDAALSKNINFMEGKSFNLRVDVMNALNHPNVSGAPGLSYDFRNYSVSQPNFDLNSANPFGYIGSKSGHRVISAKLRFSF